MSHKYILKYIVIGEAGVGKSSLMQMFTDSRFNEDQQATIGIEFGTTIVTVNDIPVKLQIWDTSGSERFKSVTRSYYRGAAGGLLVYDISRRSTFSKIGTWLADARTNTNPHTAFILIGNKSDLEEEREVSYEEAKDFATENNLEFIECSAKNGLNVEEAFLSTAKIIIDKVKCGVITTSDPDSGVQFPKELTNRHNQPIKHSPNQCSC